MTLNAHGVECKVADPCVRCQYGIPHRAVLMEYDPARGEYVTKEDRFCVVRWETRGDGHAGDDICGAEAVRGAPGLDVCEYHLERLRQWGFWEVPAEENEKARQEMIRSQRDLRREVARQEREREQLRLAEQARYSVVYFIRRVSDGAVKIGTTRHFESRMATHRRDHGAIELLLTLAGDHKLEHEMHGRFDLYRQPRSEWFAPANQLLHWVWRQRSSRTYRDSQIGDMIDIKALRKLADAAPLDEDLRWRYGRAVWPMPTAA